LASEAPRPIFIQPEDGTPGGMELESFGHLKDYSEVMSALRALATEPHDYKTVVIDTLDALEPMLQDVVCKENGWPDIEMPGFGRGYLAAATKWQKLIDGLDALRTARNMNIFLLAHSEVKTFNPPGSESYSQYGLRLQRRASAVITDAMDVVCFVNFKSELKKVETGFGKAQVHAEGGGMRWAYLEQRPAFLAKNRYQLPPESMVVRGKTFQGWSKTVPFALPEAAAPTPAPKQNAA